MCKLAQRFSANRINARNESLILLPSRKIFGKFLRTSGFSGLQRCISAGIVSSWDASCFVRVGELHRGCLFLLQMLAEPVIRLNALLPHPRLRHEREERHTRLRQASALYVMGSIVTTFKLLYGDDWMRAWCAPRSDPDVDVSGASEAPAGESPAGKAGECSQGKGRGRS